ncbi:bacillithiol biosynthesis deacetylase BshB1 [bacterium]|nr:bacillithiol biosynthesis deacetylase BshB1 [bacterium]
MKLDALFFGAHPDDVELSAGGTVAKLCKMGYKIGICDITRGEAGTRGSAEIRDKEAQEAAKILGAVARVNLNVPDTNIENNRENQLKVIQVIRRYTPDFVFTQYWDDRHPDHMHSSQLIRESAFYSGLEKIVTEDHGLTQKHFRPSRVIYYAAWFGFAPSFIVDISDTFEIKMQAMSAFASQFYDPNYKSNESQTNISTPEFREAIQVRAQHFGSLIAKKYGEPFLTKENIGTNDPIKFLRDGESAKKLGFA